VGIFNVIYNLTSSLKCLTEDGKELTRVCVVDFHSGIVLYDQLVKPSKPIVDYLTRYVSPAKLLTPPNGNCSPDGQVLRQQLSAL
jgi:hypothetical protein